MQVEYSVELGRDDPALELPWHSNNPAVRYYNLKTQPALVARIPEASPYPELCAFLTRVNAPDLPLQTAKCDAWPSREILPEEEIFGGECKFVCYVDLVFTARDDQSSFQKHEELAGDLCRLLKRAPDLCAAAEFVIRRCYFHDDEQVAQDRNLSACRDERRGEARDREESEGHGAARDREVSERREAETSCQEGGHRVELDLGGESECHGAARDREESEGHGAARDREVSERRGEITRLQQGADGLSGTPVLGALVDLRSGFYLTAYITGFGNSSDQAGKRWAIALTLVHHALVQAAKR